MAETRLDRLEGAVGGAEIATSAEARKDRSGSTIEIPKEEQLLLCGGYVRELAPASYPHSHGGGGDFPCIAGGGHGCWRLSPLTRPSLLPSPDPASSVENILITPKYGVSFVTGRGSGTAPSRRYNRSPILRRLVAVADVTNAARCGGRCLPAHFPIGDMLVAWRGLAWPGLRNVSGRRERA